MSHNSRNFVLAYAFLVILPLFGLAGILKVGRHVKAPISIDGDWALRMDHSQLASLPCGQALAAVDENSLLISQSGETFSLSFADGPTVLASSGIVNGATLHASITPSRGWSSEASCGARKLSIDAAVDPNTNDKSLSGKISVNDCSSCTPVDFHAVRRAPPASQGGH